MTTPSGWTGALRRALRYAQLAAILAAAALAPLAAAAQPRQAPGGEAPAARANAGTVGVISGGVDGTDLRMVADLANVLDDGTRLRVLPVIGKGSIQNISDILYLHGIDVGIVQSDALAYARDQHLFPSLDQSIQYVAKLYDEEVHVLARRDITRISDLAGKKVNVDASGSDTAMTASVLFGALGIKPQFVTDPQDAALEKLKAGQIAGLVYVTSKPAHLFTTLGPDAPVHFLSVPSNEALLATYVPAQLSANDYPGLVSADAPVDTVAVDAVMAVFARSPSDDRYARVVHFVDALVDHIGDLQKPPHRPEWRALSLAEQVPGWTRFPPAEEALRRQAFAAKGPVQADFSRFLTSGSPGGAVLSDAQRDALFRDFLGWQRGQK